MEKLTRADSPYRFRIPRDLIPKLRGLRAQQKDWRELIDAEDVLHLHYGLGPAWFLALDGRVIVDNYDWDGTGAYEVTSPKKAWIIIVNAANLLKFPDLLRILPERPPDTIYCLKCGGTGWRALPQVLGDRGVVCEEGCGGLGWLPRDVT